jgi:hypothetical protein
MTARKTPETIQILLLALTSILLCSCGSTVGVGGGKSSFVSTSIENSSRSAVDAAVASVFREEGFSLLTRDANQFNFRKWGGRSTEIIYGSWFADGVAIEPEVIVFDKGAGAFTVHCDVYMREHTGSELLDANWRLLGSGKIAYSGMMRKIRARAEAQ